MEMEMDALFSAAAAAVHSLPRFTLQPAALPRESERLMLYGLYKQALVGAVAERRGVGEGREREREIERER